MLEIIPCPPQEQASNKSCSSFSFAWTQREPLLTWWLQSNRPEHRGEQGGCPRSPSLPTTFFTRAEGIFLSPKCKHLRSDINISNCRLRKLVFGQYQQRRRMLCTLRTLNFGDALLVVCRITASVLPMEIVDSFLREKNWTCRELNTSSG